MCTLSWWIGREARGVLFNRDEKRTRSRGLPPRIVPSESGDLLMPLDPDAGGTWIGANQSGLIVALLNNYPHYQDAIPNQRSRGQLVVDLLKRSENARECMELLQKEDVSRCRGFLLFAMDSTASPIASEWAGDSLKPLPLLEEGGLHLLTTSSVRREDCEDYRYELFSPESRELEYLRSKHQHFRSEDPALGPLMVRDDAATDSIIEIQVDAKQVEMNFRTISGNPPELQSPVIESIPLAVAR